MNWPVERQIHTLGSQTHTHIYTVQWRITCHSVCDEWQTDCYTKLVRWHSSADTSLAYHTHLQQQTCQASPATHTNTQRQQAHAHRQQMHRHTHLVVSLWEEGLLGSLQPEAGLRLKEGEGLEVALHLKQM